MYQELVRQLIQKLKIVLQSKIFIFVLLLVTILYSYYILNNNIYKTKYNENTTNITGVIDSIKINNNKLTLTIKNKEKIMVNYYINSDEELDLIKKYKLGDKIKVLGSIKLPNKNTNFNLFNYRNYLLSKKIYWIFTANTIEIVEHNKDLIYKVKNIIYNRIDNINKTKDYLKMFIIGDSTSLDGNIKQTYQNNGIIHLFCISGMHVSFITSIILLILNKISKNKFINNSITILFLIFYCLIVNISASIIRVCLFYIILCINKKLNIKIINLFIIFSCIMIIINPYNLYNSGFLFSYIITFYLMLFNKLISKYKNKLLKSLILSIICFLASLPILINNYFSVNLLTIINNLFFIPYVTFIVFPLSILTFIFPILDNILIIFINILENISLFINNIKIFNITLCHIPFYIFLFYYLIITLILYKIYNNKYYYILILIIILFVHSNYLYFNSKTIITFMDVGQGDCSLIFSPHNKSIILIDTGGKINYKNTNEYSIAKSTIIPYLKSAGVKKLNYLILTHGDYDHMGEAINLVENFKVEKVIFNCGPYNDLERDLIKVLVKKKIPYYSCIKELNIDNNKLYFLNNGDYGNENDNSSVIYTELNNYKFLFMGDAGVEVEEDLIEKYNLRNIDVLKVGHHGSRTSSSEEFIDEVNPQYSIISVGKNNRYGHPNDNVLNNLINSKIYRTDIDGSIMFKIKNNKLKIETCSP